jgi:hypothetical protein
LRLASSPKFKFFTISSGIILFDLIKFNFTTKVLSLEF